MNEPITAATLRKFNQDNVLACEGLPLLGDVARELKMSPLSLYKLLNKERVLYLRSKPRNSDEREHFGRTVVYSDFMKKKIFTYERIVHEHADGSVSESSRLRISHKGVKFIKALVKNKRPTAMDIYRLEFPNETK